MHYKMLAFPHFMSSYYSDIVLFFLWFHLLSFCLGHIKQLLALCSGGRFQMFFVMLGNLVVCNQFVCMEEPLKDLKYLL